MMELPLSFEFATAARIIFREGACRDLPSLAAAMGSRALVVTGSNPQRAMEYCLPRQDIDWHFSPIQGGEPTVDAVLSGVEAGRSHGCDLVIGFGGGGAVDAGKAIAALLANQGDIFDYLEVIGKAQPLMRPSLPNIAVPTTAGTGAEVTRNAVIKSPTHQVKVSLRSPLMLPKLALVDPALTISMPPEVTASTGLDALTQLIEAYTTRNANPITDALCETGITAAASSLLRAWSDATDREAREKMSLASLLSGLVLANAGLGAVHGFAAPLGGLFEAPHGIVCAALLPAVFEANIKAIGHGPASRRFAHIGALLTGSPDADARHALQWIRQTCETLHVPTLGKLGITSTEIPLIVEKARKASSMKGNPVALDDETLAEILRRSI